MNRAEIREKFRQENPEVTDRVLTDTVLNSWLIEGNQKFACETMIITKTDSFTTTSGLNGYNLSSEFSDFYEIDEFPGGGVAYNGKRLKLTTKAELDFQNSSWRSNSSGTPKKYYRRGESIYFERAPNAAVSVTVDYAAIPEAFNNDSLEPFNGIATLKPYHYALVLYLQGRAKMAVNKDKDKVDSMAEYNAYVEWCKKQVRAGKFGPIQFKVADGPVARSSYRI